MNEVPVIRKGNYKDYLKPAVCGGFALGLMCFLLALTQQPVTFALRTGVLVWMGVIILFMGVGFPVEEYFRRKQRIKKLKSKKYSFLHGESFLLHSDLFFEGTYKGYFIRILPMSRLQNARKEIEYDIIEAFYTFDPENNEGKEEYMTGRYFLGMLYFSEHCVGFIPKDWRNPDFKNNLDGLISIMKREDLKPFTKEEWENSFGKNLKEQKEKDEKARTKQIIKIRKLLDVKYIENHKTK